MISRNILFLVYSHSYVCSDSVVPALVVPAPLTMSAHETDVATAGIVVRVLFCLLVSWTVLWPDRLVSPTQSPVHTVRKDWPS
jgi:hypothetical protein